MSRPLDWFFDHSRDFLGELRREELLQRHTYYRIGGPAAVMAIPRGESDLRWLKQGIDASSCQWVVLGLGSNLLVSDNGFPGLVIKTSRLDQGIEPAGDGLLRTGCSVAVSSLLRRAAQEGWGGFECLAGVPGSIGGVVVMNAGTHLGEARDRIEQVESFDLITLAARVWRKSEMAFEYRKNLFLPRGHVVTGVTWRIDHEEPMQVRRRIDETLERRKSTQPVDFPSCGSVFKNPRSAGLRAWEVVDKLGLRGHRIGGAQFAPKHSNFIINLGSARAEDVRGLIELAKTRARAELGIELEEEVKYLGVFGGSL